MAQQKEKAVEPASGRSSRSSATAGDDDDAAAAAAGPARARLAEEALRDCAPWQTGAKGATKYSARASVNATATATANGCGQAPELASWRGRPAGSTGCLRPDEGRRHTRRRVQRCASRKGGDGPSAEEAARRSRREEKERRRWSLHSRWSWSWSWRCWTVAREQAGGVLDPWSCRVFSSKNPTCPVGHGGSLHLHSQ